MNRLTTKIHLLVIVAAVTLMAGPAQANQKKVLEDAGLALSGLEYVLPDEAEIIQARREIKDAQRAMKEAEDDFRDAEKKIAKAQAYLAHLQREMDQMKDKVRKSDSQNEYARHMKAYDELVQLIETTQEDRKAFEKDQQVKIDDARAAFIATMVTWVEKAQAISEQYEALNKDQVINEAIEHKSQEDKRRYTLGPSRRFASIQRELAKAASEYQRGAVDVRKEGNVLMIDVRINGKPIRSMILDTGASSVSLPYQFAKDLGIEPSETDPVVQVQMADGKIVDARQVKLDSVQVGEFIVNDVTAMVLPEDLHAAPPLLGNTFLGNFLMEIDPDRGKLILSRLNPPKEKA